MTQDAGTVRVPSEKVPAVVQDGETVLEIYRGLDTGSTYRITPDGRLERLADYYGGLDGAPGTVWQDCHANNSFQCISDGGAIITYRFRCGELDRIESTSVSTIGE